MKKILIITPTNPNDKHGHSGVVYSISESLKKQGYTIDWLQPKATIGGILRNCFQLLVVYTMKAMGFTISHHPAISKMYAYYLNKEIKKRDFDYILGFESIYLSYIDSENPILYRSDAVYHSMVNYYIFNVSPYAVKCGDKVELLTLQKIKYMFVPSQWVIDEIKDHYPSIDIEKIKLVHSGANMPYLEQMPVRVEHGELLNILFIGSNPFRKGIDVAYETVRIINEQYNRKAQLIVIGGDIKEYRDKDYVRYLGVLNKNIPQQMDLFVKTLQETDWFIFPTKAECAGIVNCEVSAYGIPIVAFNTGGVSSYVINGTNGILMDLSAKASEIAESIASLSEAEYKRYAQNGRLLYEKAFNWDVWGKRVDGILNNK